jgi:protein-disulfide isomerase
MFGNFSAAAADRSALTARTTGIRKLFSRARQRLEPRHAPHRPADCASSSGFELSWRRPGRGRGRFQRALPGLLLVWGIAFCALSSGSEVRGQLLGGEKVVRLDGPMKGSKDAVVTLVEFSDYECSFCGRHVRETLPSIQKEYIDTGKLKYVFRDFPLVTVHKDAFKAAEAAHCAGEQGRYWEMHDRLFFNQNILSPESFPIHAQVIKLDLLKFQVCLFGGKYAGTIQKNMAEGEKADVKSTPTFLLGLTKPNASEMKVLKMLVGAQPYANFKQAIEGLLATAQAGKF